MWQFFSTMRFRWFIFLEIVFRPYFWGVSSKNPEKYKVGKVRKFDEKTENYFKKYAFVFVNNIFKNVGGYKISRRLPGVFLLSSSNNTFRVFKIYWLMIFSLIFVSLSVQFILQNICIDGTVERRIWKWIRAFFIIFRRIWNIQGKLFIQYSVQWGQNSFFFSVKLPTLFIQK